MFDKKEDKLLTYRIDAETNIEVYSSGYGATSKDFTEIKKTTSSGSALIKRIDGSYSGYQVKIDHVNDTIFKITFIDTAIFKGMKKTFVFNINENLNKYVERANE
jgi:uncharacterized protein (UPF0264 family)